MNRKALSAFLISLLVVGFSAMGASAGVLNLYDSGSDWQSGTANENVTYTSEGIQFDYLGEWRENTSNIEDVEKISLEGYASTSDYPFEIFFLDSNLDQVGSTSATITNTTEYIYRAGIDNNQQTLVEETGNSSFSVNDANTTIIFENGKDYMEFTSTGTPPEVYAQETGYDFSPKNVSSIETELITDGTITLELQYWDGNGSFVDSTTVDYTTNGTKTHFIDPPQGAERFDITYYHPSDSGSNPDAIHSSIIRHSVDVDVSNVNNDKPEYWGIRSAENSFYAGDTVTFTGAQLVNTTAGTNYENWIEPLKIQSSSNPWEGDTLNSFLSVDPNFRVYNPNNETVDTASDNAVLTIYDGQGNSVTASAGWSWIDPTSTRDAWTSSGYEGNTIDLSSLNSSQDNWTFEYTVKDTPSQDSGAVFPGDTKNVTVNVPKGFVYGTSQWADYDAYEENGENTLGISQNVDSGDFTVDYELQNDNNDVVSTGSASINNWNAGEKRLLNVSYNSSNFEDKDVQVNIDVKASNGTTVDQHTENFDIRMPVEISSTGLNDGDSISVTEDYQPTASVSSQNAPDTNPIGDIRLEVTDGTTTVSTTGGWNYYFDSNNPFRNDDPNPSVNLTKLDETKKWTVTYKTGNITDNEGRAYPGTQKQIEVFPPGINKPPAFGTPVVSFDGNQITIDLPVDDRGEQDIFSNSVSSGYSVTNFTNSTLTVTGSGSLNASVSDNESATTNREVNVSVNVGQASAYNTQFYTHSLDTQYVQQSVGIQNNGNSTVNLDWTKFQPQGVEGMKKVEFEPGIPDVSAGDSVSGAYTIEVDQINETNVQFQANETGAIKIEGDFGAEANAEVESADDFENVDITSIAPGQTACSSNQGVGKANLSAGTNNIAVGLTCQTGSVQPWQKAGNTTWETTVEVNTDATKENSLQFSIPKDVITGGEPAKYPVSNNTGSTTAMEIYNPENGDLLYSKVTPYGREVGGIGEFNGAEQLVYKNRDNQIVHINTDTDEVTNTTVEMDGDLVTVEDFDSDGTEDDVFGVITSGNGYYELGYTDISENQTETMINWSSSSNFFGISEPFQWDADNRSEVAVIRLNGNTTVIDSAGQEETVATGGNLGAVPGDYDGDSEAEIMATNFTAGFGSYKNNVTVYDRNGSNYEVFDEQVFPGASYDYDDDGKDDAIYSSANSKVILGKIVDGVNTTLVDGRTRFPGSQDVENPIAGGIIPDNLDVSVDGKESDLKINETDNQFVITVEDDFGDSSLESGTHTAKVFEASEDGGGGAIGGGGDDSDEGKQVEITDTTWKVPTDGQPTRSFTVENSAQNQRAVSLRIPTTSEEEQCGAFRIEEDGDFVRTTTVNVDEESSKEVKTQIILPADTEEEYTCELSASANGNSFDAVLTAQPESEGLLNAITGAFSIDQPLNAIGDSDEQSAESGGTTFLVTALILVSIAGIAVARYYGYKPSEKIRDFYNAVN